MKRRGWLALPLLGCAFLFPTQSSAQDAVERAIGNIFNRLGNRLVDELGNEIDRNRTQQAAEVGYCQVWSGSRLTVQGQCRVDRQCDQAGNCISGYAWSTGGRTEVFMQNGGPTSINGQPTAFVQIGPDLCFADNPPGNNFCYTRSPQQPNLQVRNTYPPAPKQQAAPSQKQAVVRRELDPVPDAESQPGQDIDIDSLLSAYVTAAESSDPSSKQDRCDIGMILVSDYKDTLDSEIKTLIVEQLVEDDCLG